MKRIVFLDYIRVFACFLVILVHASENFYGAPGSTDMAGPQSFLANEADRLWVSVYDGFSRMAVPLFMIVSAFLLAPMKEEQSMWQFYRQRCLRILPPFFIFMLLYSTLPMLWGQIDGVRASFACGRGHPQTYQIWERVFGETDESGIKLQTEGGFTRKKLVNSYLQRGERDEKRKRTLRGK